MENADRELLLRIAADNPNLKRLYDKHRKLEKEVDNLQKYAAYSATAKLRQKELKKQKLVGMEKMMAILTAHKQLLVPTLEG